MHDEPSYSPNLCSEEIGCTYLTDMASYQLHYFDLRGRAQCIRYMLADNDIEFDDVVPCHNWNEWFYKVKLSVPFGQLPVLKDGDREVAGTTAILRYLARQHDLLPTDLDDIIRADMILENAEDVRTGYYTKLIYNSFDAVKIDYIKGFMPEKFKPLEKVLKSWGNDFTNSKICFADYDLFDVLDVHEMLCPGYLEAYPTLEAFYDRVSKRPKIREMRETEVFKNRKLHGNGLQ